MTNKGMLPEILVREMRDAFKRSEEFLDLETSNEDPILGHKEAMQQTIRDATPEELGSMLEVFQRMNIGNMGGGGARQTVVTSDRTKQMILQGWVFIGTLPNGKVVLENET